MNRDVADDLATDETRIEHGCRQKSAVFHRCSIRGYLIAAVMLLGLASLAWACNVPVFRFALERWRPDPYQVVLLHRGPLGDAEREVIRPLVEQEEAGLANVAVRTVDVDKIDAESEEDAADAALLAALSPEGEPPLPLLVLQYPPHLKIAKPVWSGPPTAESVASLADSPARKELARRLAAGQTAVWLVLEHAGASEDAAALVESEIEKLQEQLELPELTDAPEDAISASAPLKIEFSVLRIRRDDPAEQALVAMLLGSEPDLAGRTEPMVFPVFGRGRALWGLIGAGVTARNIHDSASFLVGPCSCEVKELNPGFDLLVSADWEELLAAGGMPLIAASASEPTAIPAEAELVPIPTGAAPTPTAVTFPAPVVVEQELLPPFLVGRPLLIGGGLLLVGLIVVGAIVALSQSRERDAPS